MALQREQEGGCGRWICFPSTSELPPLPFTTAPLWFHPSMRSPFGGCCTAWETNVWPSEHSRNTLKASEIPGGPNAGAQEHTYTAWSDMSIWTLGWVNPWPDVQQHCCAFGAGASEPLGQAEKLCGAPSLSGHAKGHALNVPQV